MHKHKQNNGLHVAGGVGLAGALWALVAAAPWAVVGAVVGALVVACVALLALAWYVPPHARTGYVPPVRAARTVRASWYAVGSSMWAPQGSSLGGRASLATVRRGA